MSGGSSQVVFPRHDVTTDDVMKYRGSRYTFSRRRNDTLDFIDPKNQELLSLSDEQLAGLICSGEASLISATATKKDEAYAAATMDLAAVPSPSVEEARRQQAYVDEMQIRSLIYRPSKADVESAISDVAIKISDPQPPAPYLVKRWLKKGIKRAAAAGRRISEIGAADLVTQHKFKGNRTSRVSFEVSKIIHTEIDRVYLTPECRSVETLLAICRDKVRIANRNRLPIDELKTPGRKAVQSAIDSLDVGELLTKRGNADRAYDKLGYVQYRDRPDKPLAEVEMDHTTCDLFVVDGLTGAPMGRPVIAAAIDRCTAMPWGLHVGFDPPSVHTVMQCLRNGIFPKTYVEIYKKAGLWDIEGSWGSCGIPDKLSVDRGAENINHDIKAFGNDLPIKEIEAKAGRKGRLKGQIERHLGTVNRDLLQEQRGTTFSNIIDRDDYDPKKNAVITYEELLEILHIFIIDIYIRRKHGGLKDTPIRVWNAKVEAHPPRQLRNVETVLPLFGRIEHRRHRRDGIRWKHLFFNSPEFNALLGDNEYLKASTNAAGKVIVRFRYDPSNIDHVHVYLPHARGEDSMHLKVPVEKRSAEYARGLSVWAHDGIVKMARDEVDASIDQEALDRAKVKLLLHMEKDTPGSTKVRSSRRLARFRQIGGVSPYGDSIKTTPKGSFEDRRQAEASCEAYEQEIATAGSEDHPETSGKYKRESDPATPRKPRKSRNQGGRVAVHDVANAANEDEIDYYAEEMKA